VIIAIINRGALFPQITVIINQKISRNWIKFSAFIPHPEPESVFIHFTFSFFVVLKKGTGAISSIYFQHCFSYWRKSSALLS
jgi:hypothetical protein